VTDIYVRSSDGADADSGLTWALAKATIAGAIAIDNAGDNIWLADGHTETLGTATTYSFAGTINLPTNLVAALSTSEPPNTAGAATISSTGIVTIQINSNIYVNGVTFSCGTGATGASMTLANADLDVQYYENCTLRLNSTAVGVRIFIGSLTATTEADVTFKNCIVQFGSSGQYISLRGATFRWEGGGIFTGSSPTQLFSANAGPGVCKIDVSAIDISAMSASIRLCTLNAGHIIATFRDCKFPAGWTRDVANALTVGSRVEVHNCSGGDTNYTMYIEDYFGEIDAVSTDYRNGGASDGTTPISWKMTSTANVHYPSQVLRSPDIVVWNDTIGVAVTVTVEIANDFGSTLTDGDIWLEVLYLGYSGSTRGYWVSGCKATVFTNQANHPSSSATWTESAIGTITKQKMSVICFPQEKGPIVVRVVKGSHVCPVVYVDPYLTIT